MVEHRPEPTIRPSTARKMCLSHLERIENAGRVIHELIERVVAIQSPPSRRKPWRSTRRQWQSPRGLG
jgi:hypothetical protein